LDTYLPLAVTLIAIALYALGFKLQLDRLRDPEEAGQISLWLPALALACHAYVCAKLVVVEGSLDLGLIAVANVASLVIVSVFVIGHLRLPVANLYLFIFPISAALLLLSLFIEPGSAPASDLTPIMIAHILISLGAYSALMMAALQSLILSSQERRLKTHTSPVRQILPPLETMEHLLVAMLWFGLVLLTASIITGWLFIEDMFEQRIVHHVVITTLSWLTYVVFLIGRYMLGWRGTTAVRWTLVGFGLLVLGYFGSKFVLEYLLQ
jgi:ABC-type uncharacterized transport system permease subunit